MDHGEGMWKYVMKSAPTTKGSCVNPSERNVYCWSIISCPGDFFEWYPLKPKLKSRGSITERNLRSQRPTSEQLISATIRKSYKGLFDIVSWYTWNPIQWKMYLEKRTPQNFLLVLRIDVWREKITPDQHQNSQSNRSAPLKIFLGCFLTLFSRIYFKKRKTMQKDMPSCREEDKDSHESGFFFKTSQLLCTRRLKTVSPAVFMPFWRSVALITWSAGGHPIFGAFVPNSSPDHRRRRQIMLSQTAVLRHKNVKSNHRRARLNICTVCGSNSKWSGLWNSSRASLLSESLKRAPF